MSLHKMQHIQDEKDDLHKAYRSYVILSNLKRFRVASLLGVVLFPAGSLFDYYIYPEQFWAFFGIRLATSIACFFFFLVSYMVFVKNYLSQLIIFLAIFMAIPIIVMVMFTGGHASAYYAGLILIIFGMGLLFTLLTMLEAAIVCGSIYLAYLIPILTVDEITNWSVFLNNNYFLSFVVIMALVSNYFNWKTRFSDFESFKTIENLNKHLNEKTSNLEKTMTELKQTQAQLVHSAKLAGIGTLAAGVAHEINNALNSSLPGGLFLNQIWREIKADPSVLQKEADTIETTLHLINTGMNRTHNIVLQLLRFTRKNAEGFKPDNIHDGIEASLALLQNELHVHHIQVHKDFCSTKEVFCNLSELNQVFFNILKNGIDAIGKHGHIWITTRVEEGNFVLSFKDSGVGIAPEHLPQIFNPFFTTKPVGKGTGLGLATSYNIVKDHGGNIEVNSSPGNGAEFVIFIPIEGIQYERKAG